jgi:hypothetical protein
MFQALGNVAPLIPWSWYAPGWSTSSTNMALPRAGQLMLTFLWYAPIVKLDRLPGKPGDGPCVCGITVVPAGSRLTS